VDALGLTFMDDTYTASYTEGKTDLSVFLSKKNSDQTALTILDKFTTHAKKYGEGLDNIKEGDINLVSCDMGGSYDVVFCKGPLIAGITSAEDEQAAIEAAIDLWRQL
jgi:hypothetical protein